MTAGDAHAIAAWRYPDPFSFYDWDRDPDDLAELLDPSEWGRRYFAADDVDSRLAGFFSFRLADGVAEIGLGLRPDLTGIGIGESFLATGLQFAAANLGARGYVLAVAAFNHRAIAVYERAGFREMKRYEHRTDDGLHEFVSMARGPLAPSS